MKNTIITNTKRQLLMLCAALCCAVMWGANPTAPDISAVNETSYQLTVNSGANGVTSVTYFVDSTDEIPETGDTRQYSVIEGVEVSFTFTPSSEYSVGSVTVDGVDVTASLQPGMTSPTVKTYTLAPMSADVTVQVTYAKNYTDGEVFTAQTIEGVNMDFKVISAADMTCQVGDGSHSSIADGVTVVTVPSVVNGFTVTTVGSNAFWRGAFGALTTVTLPSTITSIGNNAFESCGALTAIVIPEAVTTIGDNAFLQCYDLASVTMPPTITYIGESAFKSTPSLTSIELPTSITTISAQAFYSSGLTSITIPEGVTSIGESAFNSCSSLATVNFPASLLTIGKGAFSLNSALTAINLPSQLQTIGESAFGNCELVTSITIPASVTTIESWGLSINNLKWVTVEGTTPPTITENSFSGGTTGYGVLYVQQDAIDTYHASEYWNVFNRIYAIGKHPYAVLDGNTLTFYCNDQRDTYAEPFELNFTSINNSPLYGHKDEIVNVVFDDSFADFTELTSTANWFYDCGNLTSISGLEKVNTSKVTNMEYMFEGCRSLTSLDISNFDLSSVQTMSCMFRSCSGLTNINLGNFNASSTTSFSQMFQGCTSLETINISDANTSSATTMYAMFNGCRALTELNLGSFNTANVTDMYMMFANCNALKTIYVGSGWTTAAVTDNGTGMFSDCNNLEGGAGTTWASMAAAYVENCNNYQFAHIDGGTSNPGYLTDVADYGKVEEPYAVLSDENTKLTFYYDKHKEQNNGMDVNFTDNTLRGWNSSASYITEVVFDPSFANCTTLTSTAWLFWSMGNLTTITGIENLKTDHVTNMYSMFAYCPKLASLDVSGFNTSKVTDMGYMFGGCSGLTTLNVSGFNTSNVTNMRNMFDSCSGLTSLDVSNFNTANVTNMYGMFMNCSGLTTLDLSSFNTAKVEVMDNMFCQNSLTTIYVDGTKWNTGAVTSSISMFYMCPNLVGGQGTVYDINRVDASYAHIDGGTSNPGYFTPKSGYVEAPTFAWNADELTMTSGTDGATIYYTLTDAVTSTPTPTQYTAPITVTSDVLIEAYAEKDGMARSMTTVLDYPYTAWMQLITAIADAQNVFASADGNDNITDEQRGALNSKISVAQAMYIARTDSVGAINQMTTDLVTLTETIRQLVNAENEPYAVLAENTLTFYYDNQKDGRTGTVMSLTSGIPAWHDNSYDIKVAEFAPSFVDYYPTSTAYWFSGCIHLTNINGIENLKTDSVTDMSRMFYMCRSLNTLDVSNFNTSNVTNMFSMFNDAWVLDLDVSNFNTAKVMNMGEMFMNCNQLHELNLSNFNTANVTDMHSMFNGCTGLTNLDLSSFNTSNVTDTWGMFLSCNSLTSLNVGSFNTAKVTKMDSMFGTCSLLSNLDVSNFDTSNVTSMYCMFNGCSSLTVLNLSSFNTEKVEIMTGMFQNAANLSTIYVGDGWTTSVVTSHENMFANCSSLVGGSGTTYDADHVGADYAHIDGGESSPGYFTAAGEEPFQESKNWSVVGTLAGSSESGVTMIAIDETNYTATFTLLPAGVYEYKVRDDNNIDRTYGQPDGSDVTVTVPEDNYSVTILFNAKTKAVSHELADPIYSVIGFTSADGSGRSEFVMQRDSVGVPYTVSTSVSMGTRTFKISINHEDSVYYGKKGQLKGEPIAFYTPMAGMNVTFYFDPVTKLATTSVGIIKDKYAVHVSVAGNGSVVATETDDTGTEQSSTIVNGTSEEDVEVTEDNTLTLTLQPADGNHLVSLIVDGVDVTSQIEDNKYMLPAIAETHTVSVTYVQNDLEPYAVLSGDNTTLTFYYDDQKVARNGMDIGPFAYLEHGFGESQRPWHDFRESITDVVFDSSMANDTTLISTGWWFYGCTNLKRTSGWQYLPTANIVDMWGMFENCSSLSSNPVEGGPDFSAFNTASLKRTCYLFHGCTSMTSIDLSTFNTANVTETEGMFKDCAALTTIYVGSGWTMTNVSGNWVDDMFSGSTSLVGGAGTTYDASNIGVSYAHIDGGPDNPGYFTRSGDAPYVAPEAYAVLSGDSITLTFYYDNQKESRGGRSFLSGTEVYWPNYVTGVKKVSFDESFADFSPTSTSSWFAGFNSLTSVEGMEYLNTEHVISMISMFQYCENLTSLDLSRLQTGHVETMTNMFYGCKRLANLNLSGFSTANVTSLASMFYGCQSLTMIDLSSFNTSNVTRMEEMFQDCAGLTTLDLTNFNTENVENMTLMFAGCTNLATIYAGSGWSVAKTADSRQMFYDCTSLVGGQGTVYDAEYTDKTYAHIDGGTSNPGYLTLKLAMGDANGDGNINIADAVATVTNILGQPTEAAFYMYAADMNTDQVIDIFDVTLIVNAAFEAASPAPAMTRGSADNIMTENISMTADADYIYLGIDQPERFTATQFDVTLPEGMELVDARLASATTDHQLSFVKRGNNEYRVIGLSMSNTTFRSMNGQLIKLEVSGSAVDSDVKMSNVLFVTPTATVMTSIDKCLNTAKAADDSLYDLKGQRLSNQQLGKGIYIMNHKKVIIK